MSADAFPDFELLPPSADALTADDELAELVGPEDPALTNEVDDGSPPLGRSRWFDFDTGNSGGLPRWVYGNEAVVMVAQAALRTKRGECAMLPDDFGMDDPDALVGEVYDAERVGAYEDDIRETLLACHERITEVSGFMFLTDIDGEIAYVDLDIYIDGNAKERLEGVPLGS